MSQAVPDDLLTTPVSALFFDGNLLWRYRASPTRIIDGDTFVAIIDLGYNVRYEPHIRIAGLDAPELSTPDGPVARQRLMDALYRNAYLVGWNLRVVSREKTTFERWLCDVFVLQDDGSLIDVKDLL